MPYVILKVKTKPGDNYEYSRIPNGHTYTTIAMAGSYVEVMNKRLKDDDNYHYEAASVEFADKMCPIDMQPVSKATLVDERELIAYRIEPANPDDCILEIGISTINGSKKLSISSDEDGTSAIFIGKEELILLSQVIKQALEVM